MFDWKGFSVAGSANNFVTGPRASSKQAAPIDWGQVAANAITSQAIERKAKTEADSALATTRITADANVEVAKIGAEASKYGFDKKYQGDLGAAAINADAIIGKANIDADATKFAYDTTLRGKLAEIDYNRYKTDVDSGIVDSPYFKRQGALNRVNAAVSLLRGFGGKGETPQPQMPMPSIPGKGSKPAEADTSPFGGFFGKGVDDSRYGTPLTSSAGAAVSSSFRDPAFSGGQGGGQPSSPGAVGYSPQQTPVVAPIGGGASGGEGKPSGSPGSRGSSGQSDARDRVSGARELMKYGLVPKGAAMLASHVDTESNWQGQRKPWVLNDGAGTNKGILSWNKDRITSAESYLGKPLETASNNEQIRFMANELRSKYPDSWKTFTDPNADDKALWNAAYKYIGWGDKNSEGRRWDGYYQTFGALQAQ